MEELEFDLFCVIDFESIIYNEIYEITDFPAILIDGKTGSILDSFHKFVKPVKTPEDVVMHYVERKYGKMNLAEEWKKSADTFDIVLRSFNDWFLEKIRNRRFAFITCGDWDIGRMLPSNCKLLGIDVPSYFREWINIKDIYCKHYNSKRKGMKAMLQSLDIPLEGFHHSGKDDAYNIVKIAAKLLSDSARFMITASIEKSSDFTNDEDNESFSDFKVSRQVVIKKEKRVESNPVKTVTIVVNGQKVNSGIPKQITTNDWNVFLKQIKNKTKLAAKRIFKADGKEIFSVMEVEDGDILYASSGEDYRHS